MNSARLKVLVVALLSQHLMSLLSAQTDLPMIHRAIPVQETVEQFGKYEATLDLTAEYLNPYDYDDIEITAVFTGPDGHERKVDGFYMHEYALNQTDGSLDKTGEEGVFKVRFSPDAEGAWSCRITVRDRNGQSSAEELDFTCTARTTATNRGFVRSTLTNYLQFDNGEQFIPVGQNVAWQIGNPFLDYSKWLGEMRRNGGNYFRLWHAHWGLGIEWKEGWNDFAGLRRYKETNMRYQDWLFDHCAENGIYLMLALQHHGQVSSQVNPNWNDSPYNASNDGPCSHTWDFFIDETAKGHTKNRFRYILARWGYSRAIMAWELFNEVEWTDDFEKTKTKVQDWHLEMAAYLKEKDPYNHLVTTSFAHESYDPLVWNNPDIDITQTHFYLNTGNIERALAGGVRNYLNLYGKPTLTGEFGLGAYSELAEADRDGIHLHNSLWGALFGGGMGSAMSWWWDSYVHPADLYYHFDGLSKMVQDVPFDEENMSPARSYVIGEPGDLSLIPTAGWGEIGDDTIRIGTNGWVQPANPYLGIFLYGADWNTQFRSPPTFEITYPESGSFTVRTSNEMGKEAKIAIWIDGEMVLEQTAAVNTDYAVTVPAGRHFIRVDNTGKDWASIASYTFSGAGAQVDSYVLHSESREVAAGWVLNHRYNHKFLAENGEPTPVLDGELIVEDFQDGSYFINWYDCISGDIVQTGTVRAVNNQLSISLPELFWDLSFVVGGRELVNTEHLLDEVVFQVYPNPAPAGDEVRVAGDLARFDGGQATLLSASGKVVSTMPIADALFGSFDLTIPAGIPEGLYWVRLRGGQAMGSRPIFVAGN